jgi:hypothetical protein
MDRSADTRGHAARRSGEDRVQITTTPGAKRRGVSLRTNTPTHREDNDVKLVPEELIRLVERVVSCEVELPAGCRVVGA